jgi:hypothetical protein
MNFAQVQAVLTALPKTFLRPQIPFTQWLDANTAGLVRYTGASDQISQQVAAFQNARFGWLDIWGLLFNVPRFNNESDGAYLTRIAYIVLAGGGTPVGIAAWVKAVWQVDVTVQESLPAVGYSLTFITALTDAQILALLVSLARVRPAGVPITAVYKAGSGLYLNTINFFDASPSVTGAYLTSGESESLTSLPAATNSTSPSLPDLFLTDPTLNPSLSA